MGRPQSSVTVQLYEWFKQNEQHIVMNGKVLPPKSSIWSKASVELKNVLNAKAIYTNALRWFQKFQESESDKKEVACGVSMMESSNDSNMNDPDTSFEKCEQNSVKFSIELSPKVWHIIKPIDKTYARKGAGKGVRVYTILKPGVWTNVILDEIAKRRREIPCGWVFKNNKCYKSGDEFVTISAKCITCHAILSGVIPNEPEENETVKLYLEIRGIDQFRHENKGNRNVKIKGEHARQLYDTKKNATVIRREMFRQKASAFQKPYGRMVTANAIRCGKYRLRLKEKLSNDPYKALEYLKWSHKYMNTIHNIGMDPFFVFFSSPDQVKLYKVYKKKNKYTKVSGDATGGMANKLARPGDQQSGDIFYYTMVISDEFQTSINSALSEKHDASFLTFWLDEWVRITSEIPNEFTCDISMALLNAGVRAFGHTPSVAEYIDTLFDLIYDEKKHPIPPCFIRIDIAHFIKKVTTCEAIRNAPKKVRDFYIRCVVLLIGMNDIQKASEHILSVLVVATSLTEGISETRGDAVPCELHKALLIRKITGELNNDTENDTCHIEENVLNDARQEQNLYDSLQHSSVSLWLKDIKTDADEMKDYDDGDRDNIMNNLQFAAYFLNLCSQMTSSSGNAESQFKVTKQSLGDTIPCSVDKLVQELIDMTEGQIIEASQNYLKFLCDTKNTTNVGESTMDTNAITEFNDANATTEFNDTNATKEFSDSEFHETNTDLQHTNTTIDSQDIVFVFHTYIPNLDLSLFTCFHCFDSIQCLNFNKLII